MQRKFCVLSDSTSQPGFWRLQPSSFMFFEYIKKIVISTKGPYLIGEILFGFLQVLTE